MKSLLLVYFLTYGGAAIALFRPFYGLLVYMIFAILRPELLWSWSVPSEGNYSKIVGIALLIGWIIHGMGDWDLRRGQIVMRLLIGYWFCIVASAFFSANQEVAWKYVMLHSKILLPVIVGMTLISSIVEIRLLAWTLVVCLGYMAYEAHGMYYGGRLEEFRDQGMLGMDNNSICIAMVSGVGLAVFLGFSEPLLPQKLIAFALAALMVHVPLFGNSRGGMLGLLVVSVVTFLILPKKPGLLLTYAFGVLVAIRLAGPMVWERFATTFANSEHRDASAQSRFSLWADCWDVMIRNPILGIGPDHWPLIAHLYGWPRGKEAHSLWFNCGAELGFVGLGFLASFYFTTIYVIWRQLCSRSEASVQLRNMGRMGIASLSGFLVSASFVSLDALEVPFYVVLIAVGSIKLASTEELYAEQWAEQVYPGEACYLDLPIQAQPRTGTVGLGSH